MPSRTRTGSGAVLAGLAASAAVHVAFVLSLVGVNGDAGRARDAGDVSFDLAGPPSGAETLPGMDAAPAPADTVPPVPGAPRAAQNIDSLVPGGRGDGSTIVEVVYLATHIDDVTLSDSPMTVIGTNQLQRIRTALDRATEENRRATPNPADAVFLASGRGGHPERRDPAAHDARSGTPSTRAAVVGVSTATISMPTPDAWSRADDRRLGSEQDAPARGILGGTSEHESRASRVAFGRPAIDRGAAATTAEVRDARVRDDVDAELLTARMVRSFVDASRQRGPSSLDGAGGDGGHRRGTGGAGFAGGAARPYAPGPGDDGALYTGDDRYVAWYRDQSRRIQRVLLFPHARQIAMDQGLSVHRVRVRRDGTLAGTPRLVRSAGFPDLDAAALRAIEASLPFHPLPSDLAPELATLQIDLAIEFVNPMVR